MKISFARLQNSSNALTAHWGNGFRARCEKVRHFQRAIDFTTKPFDISLLITTWNVRNYLNINF
ncbi:MAG: hypothetical protein ABIP06_09715 [Pyrinomonadaceae bacterium]